MARSDDTIFPCVGVNHTLQNLLREIDARVLYSGKGGCADWGDPLRGKARVQLAATVQTVREER